MYIDYDGRGSPNWLGPLALSTICRSIWVRLSTSLPASTHDATMQLYNMLNFIQESHFLPQSSLQFTISHYRKSVRCERAEHDRLIRAGGIGAAGAAMAAPLFGSHSKKKASLDT